MTDAGSSLFAALPTLMTRTFFAELNDKVCRDPERDDAHDEQDLGPKRPRQVIVE